MPTPPEPPDTRLARLACLMNQHGPDSLIVEAFLFAHRRDRAWLGLARTARLLARALRNERKAGGR